MAKKKVKPIPASYEGVTPYLIVQGANRAIEFYKKAFGAKVKATMPAPDGKSLMHADVLIGKGHVMLADEFPEMGYKGPGALGGTPVSLCIYVKDADKVFAKAVAAGAK